MTGDNKYIYLNPDAPIVKINYSYAKYEGEIFMKAYLHSRESVLHNVKMDNVVLNWKSKVRTEQLFNNWIRSMESHTKFNIDKLKLLLKRFEVTKKIYESYDDEFRPIDKTRFQNIHLYIVFSYLLTISYKKFFNLQFLNALLKVNDIVLSNYSKLNPEDQSFFSYCIKEEINCIQNLRNSLL